MHSQHRDQTLLRIEREKVQYLTHDLSVTMRALYTWNHFYIFSRIIARVRGFDLLTTSSFRISGDNFYGFQAQPIRALNT